MNTQASYGRIGSNVTSPWAAGQAQTPRDLADYANTFRQIQEGEILEVMPTDLMLQNLGQNWRGIPTSQQNIPFITDGMGAAGEALDAYIYEGGSAAASPAERMEEEGGFTGGVDIGGGDTGAQAYAYRQSTSRAGQGRGYQRASSLGNTGYGRRQNIGGFGGAQQGLGQTFGNGLGSLGKYGQSTHGGMGQGVNRRRSNSNLYGGYGQNVNRRGSNSNLYGLQNGARRGSNSNLYGGLAHNMPRRQSNSNLYGGYGQGAMKRQSNSNLYGSQRAGAQGRGYGTGAPALQGFGAQGFNGRSGKGYAQGRQMGAQSLRRQSGNQYGQHGGYGYQY